MNRYRQSREYKSLSQMYWNTSLCKESKRLILDERRIQMDRWYKTQSCQMKPMYHQLRSETR
jgi:hypothetical protein